jgi:hypothetical protein
MEWKKFISKSPFSKRLMHYKAMKPIYSTRWRDALSLLLLTLLFGCQQAEVGNGFFPSFKGGQLQLNLQTEELVPNYPVTRASVAATTEEHTVNTLRLFFFQAANTGEPNLFVKALTVKKENITQQTDGKLQVTISLPKELDKSMPFDILVAANPQNDLYQLPEASISKQYTEEAFIREYPYTVKGVSDETSSELDYTSRPIGLSNLPMGTIIHKETAQKEIAGSLTRIVSRIDVHNTAPDYMLNSASIWNAATASTLWKSSDYGQSVQHTARFYGVEIGDGIEDIEHSLYTLNNFVSEPTTTDAVTTCLIIGMKKYPTTFSTATSEGGTAGKVYYYRVNVANEGLQYLKRNNIYRLNILRVKAEGADSEQDAMTSQHDPLLEIDNNLWDGEDLGFMQSDEQGNVLAVAKTLVTVPSSGGSERIEVIAIGTDTQLQPSFVEPVALPDGITARLEASGSSKNLYYLTVAAEHSNKERSGSFRIKFADIEAGITVKQENRNQRILELIPSTTQTLEAKAKDECPEIVVNSSGEWEAEIMGNAFSFDKEKSVTTLTGDNGSKLHFYTTGWNKGKEPLTSVVSFRLVDEPEKSVSIPLIQRRVGDIALTSSKVSGTISEIAFAPDGTIQLPDRFDGTITVQTDEGSSYPEWYIASSNQYFDITQSGSSHGKNKETFTVKAKGDNQTQGNYEEKIRVQLYNYDFKADPNYTDGYKEITVKQLPYVLSIYPTFVYALLSDAGSSPEITVTANGTWKVDIDKATSFAEVVYSKDGKSFHIQFKENTTAQMREVKVKVYIEKAPKIYKEITIQQLPKRREFRFVQTNSSINALGTGNNDCNIIWSYLSNQNYFGTKGTVQTAKNLTVQNINAASSDNYSFNTQDGILWGNKMYAWNEAKNVERFITLNTQNFIVIPLANSDTYSDVAVASLNQICRINKTDDNENPYGARDNSSNRGSVNNETVTLTLAKTYCDTNRKVTRLWNYLLNSGPFTPEGGIKIGDVSYKTSNSLYASKGLHGKWPDEFIPLILYNYNGTSCCALGIDIQHRLLIMNGQFFNSRYNNFTANSASGCFLRNLLAFMVNSTTYGTAFTDQFLNE